MPFVHVRTVKGALTDAQKLVLQQRITDLLVELEGAGSPHFRPYVWVLIDEQEPTSWSIGGVQPTLDMFERLRHTP